MLRDEWQDEPDGYSHILFGKTRLRFVTDVYTVERRHTFWKEYWPELWEWLHDRRQTAIYVERCHELWLKRAGPVIR